MALEVGNEVVSEAVGSKDVFEDAEGDSTAASVVVDNKDESGVAGEAEAAEFLVVEDDRKAAVGAGADTTDGVL